MTFPSGILRGKFLCKVCANSIEICLGFRAGNSRLQSRDNPQEMSAASIHEWAEQWILSNRNPDLLVCRESGKPERRGHDADDSE